MLQVAESNTATCKVQDIVEFMVSVTPAGCHLHKSRQEAARAHPLRETQVIEEYLSPHTLLQPCLKLLLLRKAVLSSYSLPFGSLGQQPLVRITFAVVSAHVPFVISDTYSCPSFGPGQHPRGWYSICHKQGIQNLQHLMATSESPSVTERTSYNFWGETQTLVL